VQFERCIPGEPHRPGGAHAEAPQTLIVPRAPELVVGGKRPFQIERVIRTGLSGPSDLVCRGGTFGTPPGCIGVGIPGPVLTGGSEWSSLISAFR
jgi:hypothetical protein